MEFLGLDLTQIITNFLGFAAFLWLMSRYAWNPILGFMDKRREEIAGNFRKIEKEKNDLDETRKDYDQKIAHIDEEATRRTQEAIRIGQDTARQIEDEARARAQAILQKARDDTGRNLEKARLDLKNYVVDVGVEAGRKAAMDVLDEETHRRLVERFVEELADVR